MEIANAYANLSVALLQKGCKIIAENPPAVSAVGAIGAGELQMGITIIYGCAGVWGFNPWTGDFPGRVVRGGYCLHALKVKNVRVRQ